MKYSTVTIIEVKTDDIETQFKRHAPAFHE